MKATPNGWTKESIQALILSSDRALTRAILAIYARQTEEEKSSQQTRDSNACGFSAFDAELLSSFAQRAQRGWALSDLQKELARKKMVRCWKQLLEIAASSSVAAPQVAA